MRRVDDCPIELAVSIREFFPEAEWDNAASISFLESAWDAFAVADTRDAAHPCGAELDSVGGITTTAELSIGYFQINSCNFPKWEWQRLYNARHNTGTAHLLWTEQGWAAWYFSAKLLGL
jgi:hypothetical protein